MVADLIVVCGFLKQVRFILRIFGCIIMNSPSALYFRDQSITAQDELTKVADLAILPSLRI